VPARPADERRVRVLVNLDRVDQFRRVLVELDGAVFAVLTLLAAVHQVPLKSGPQPRMLMGFRSASIERWAVTPGRRSAVRDSRIRHLADVFAAIAYTDVHRPTLAR